MKDNRDKKKTTNTTSIAKKQLKENWPVLESLKDHDEGKKIISTEKVEKHFPDLKIT